jgi:hypothetical protein
MNTLTNERERVIAAINLKLNILSDEKLDDLAREVIGLPARPTGSLPFVGWLLPETASRDTIVSTNKITSPNRTCGYY